MSQQTTDQFDPFKTDTGLKDDFDGTVADGWWATDPQNTRDPSALFGYLRIAADDGEVVEPRYSTGSGWSSFDGGKTAEHEKDRERMRGFNNNTAYAEVFTAAMATGAEEELRRRSAQELNNLGPRAIDGLWKGLRFHWEVKSETIKLKDRDTQEMREITMNRLLPTAFLGVAGAATTPVAPATQPSPVSSVPPTPQAPSPQTLAPQPGSSAPISNAPGQPSPAPVQQGAVASTPPAPSAPPVTQPGPIQQPPEVAQPPAAPPAAAAPTTAEPDWSFWGSLPVETQQGLVDKAKALAYPQFVDEACALPGATESQGLIMALGNEGLYNALRAM